MALGYSQIPLCRDAVFHGVRSQGKSLLLHFEHLAREFFQFQHGFELLPGLPNRAYRFVDMPDGLVHRILQFQLQPPLFQLRPRGVALGGAVANREVERYAAGIVGKVVVKDIREGRAQSPVQSCHEP
jgi:hypothetical protein